jgi:predicted naringenin-chalcone synthase
LNAVESAFELPQASLVTARNVLDCYGNMSSASVMFVLRSIMKNAESGDRGCGMSFGPGVTAETFLFRKV